MCENRPRMNRCEPIPHNRPTLGPLEEKAAIQAIQSGWLAQGKCVAHFENEFCDYLGLSHGSAVAVSSGTAALYLALLALGAQKKPIALPAYVCGALRNAIALAKGIPVVVDSMSKSPNIDLTAVDEAVAIVIAPHLFGLPQKIPSLLRPKHVIEDCAQALGARVRGMPVGLQGDVGVFSFFATKLMTTGGQGGMIVSKNQAIIERIKDYRLYDQRADTKERFNFQMTDLQAAIGRAQLQQFAAFVDRRAEIYARYQEAALPLLDAEIGVQPVRFRAILQTTRQQEVIEALARQQITAVIPIREAEIYAQQEDCPNALWWTQQTVSLPIYPLLKDEEVEKIIHIVQQVL